VEDLVIARLGRQPLIEVVGDPPLQLPQAFIETILIFRLQMKRCERLSNVGTGGTNPVLR
jgi:hypothetical protein